MQLNVTTDYAIRIVLYLGMRGGIIPSSEISTKMGIPQSYVLKVAKRLNLGGIIKTQTGKNGGFLLAKKTEDISMLEIIQLMEETTKINRCLEEDKYCSRFATESYPVRSFYCTLQNELETKLSSMSIHDLLNKEGGML